MKPSNLADDIAILAFISIIFLAFLTCAAIGAYTQDSPESTSKIIEFICISGAYGIVGGMIVLYLLRFLLRDQPPSE